MKAQSKPSRETTFVWPSQPQVDVKTYNEGNDLEASLSCELMPQMSMPDLGKLIIERPTIESNPKEVEETLARIADENRPTIPNQ